VPEQRRHKRARIALKVEVSHPEAGNLEVISRDMSDGGVFLLAESDARLTVGDQVRVRSKELGINGDEFGLFLKMQVVRMEQTGIGLALLEVEGPDLPERADYAPAASQLVQQSLVLVYQAQQLLLHSQGDHWRLPSFALASGANWQATLQQGFSQLLDAACLPINKADLCYVEYSYPQTNPDSECMDLLVPAYFWADTESPPPQPGNDFAWFTLPQLKQLNTPIDATVIDKVLKQGIELR